MSTLQAVSKLVYSAHKSMAGGGTGFLGPLFVSIGMPPNDVMAIVVLLSALFSPWTHAVVDPALFEQAIKVFWVAVLTGAGAGGLVYMTPNKVKAVMPLVEKALGVMMPAQPSRTVDVTLPEGATVSEKPAPAIPPIANLFGLVCAVGLMAIMLSGCASTEVATDQVEDFAKAADEDRDLAQKLADDLLGEAKGEDHRSVRLCMIFAGVTELMADRVTKADPDYAPEALGNVTVLQAVQSNLDATASNVWFETDVKLATLTLADILVEVGKDRVPRLLSNLAGGVNVLGVVDRARVAARQAELAGAVIRDARVLILQVANGAIPADVARAACQQRMERNRNRISAMLSGAL